MTLFSLSRTSAAAPSVIHLASGTGEDIQQALDNLPLNGELKLGDAVFEIRTPIQIRKSGQTLRGTGTNTVLFLAARANCPVIVLGAPLDPLGPKTSHLTLACLAINGNRGEQQVEFWRSAVDGCQLMNNGINIWNVSDVRVSNIITAHCRSGGLVTAAGVRRLTLEHYESFDSEFDGLACYQTEESRFTDLFLHDNQAAGISLDLAFNGNVIERATLTRNDFGVFMRESRKNIFRELTIRESRKHGVFVAQRSDLTSKGWELVAGTECTDNIFEDLSVAKCGGKPYLVIDASCENNRFSELVIPTALPAVGVVAVDGKPHAVAIAR